WLVEQEYPGGGRNSACDADQASLSEWQLAWFAFELVRELEFSDSECGGLGQFLLARRNQVGYVVASPRRIARDAEVVLDGEVIKQFGLLERAADSQPCAACWVGAVDRIAVEQDVPNIVTIEAADGVH